MRCRREPPLPSVPLVEEPAQEAVLVLVGSGLRSGVVLLGFLFRLVIVVEETAQQVVNITEMVVKVCNILLGTLAAGGPRFLSPEHVDRIDRRPDELARREDLK